MKKGSIIVTLVIVFSMLFSLSALSMTTIRFSFWGAPSELPPYEKIVEQFEKENPDIKVEIINAPWSSYFDKIQAMMAASDAPDVMFLHTIPSWAAKGVVENLTPYIKESNFPVQSYNKELLSTFSYEGKIYGFPRDNDTTVLYYNKDLFDQADLLYPDYSWEWDDMVKAAKKLTIKDDRDRITQYGIVLERNKWQLWVHMNGGKVVDNYDSPTKCTLNEKPAVDAIRFIADLMQGEDRVAPSVAALSQMGSSAEMFTTNRVSMVLSNAAQISGFLTNDDLHFGIAPLPKGKVRANTLGGAGFVMYSKSKHKTEAWKFMQFLCGSKGQAIFAQSGDAVPAMSKKETIDAFSNNSPNEYERRVFLTETKFGVKFPQIPNWREIFEYITRELDYVWTGQKDAEEVCDYVSKEVTKMIQESVKW